MSLPPGTSIGPYQITSALGAGGMGEVYRASDPRLGRDVAIKVLPDAFARDPERLARFEREARALAALNHPNIAQIYGLEGHALVMELLDGDTLRARVSAGPLPVRKAVDLAAQIARGLAAAHERGIIHRDLKPENIFVLRDGAIKILDFGLARQDHTSSSATMTALASPSPATDPGTIMGTVGYMAPEQVRGSALDARADLFALGCVLYELLTGQRAFQRETIAETMTAILNEDPADCATLRPELPPALVRIVHHALEKNPTERFQTARDIAFALDALSGSASAPSLSAPAPGRARMNWIWASVATVLAGIVLWQMFSPRREPPAAAPLTYSLRIPLPEGFYDPDGSFPSLRIALSPDGSQIAIAGAIAGEKSRIWLQSLTGATFHAIQGTEGGFAPFWSPDGQRLAFAASATLRVVALDNGTSTTVGQSGAGSWGPGDNLIVGRVRTPIWKATPAGSPYVPILKPTPEDNFGIPYVLPDGQRFIYRHQHLNHPENDGIYVAGLDGTAPTRVLASRETDNINVAYRSGALLYMRGTSVVAQAFDLETLAASGEPVTVADGVLTRNLQGGAFSVSNNGTLAYLPIESQLASRLTWVSRTGQTLQSVSDDADYSNLELSPDGTRLLVSVTDAKAKSRDIFIVDVARGVRQRLTFDPTDERSAIWSADGRTVIYNARGLDLYSRASSFTGAETPLLTDGTSKDPRQVSPDGKSMIYRRSGTGTSNDIWIMPLEGDRTPRLLVGTPFSENYASFSPDGQSIVYVSDESGQPEVYVMSLAGTGLKVQVSTGGGSFPRWPHGGHEILFLTPTGTMMSVPVSGSGSALQAGTPRALFTTNVQPGPGTPFDVTPDGQRFLVNAVIPSKSAPSIGVVINWPSLLSKKAVP